MVRGGVVEGTAVEAGVTAPYLVSRIFLVLEKLSLHGCVRPFFGFSTPPRYN